MERKHYLLVSDFDQTLSFNDSGHVLSEMLGIRDFAERAAGLSRLNLVQSGAELAYLILHDPEYRRVRRADLIEVGRRIRLKQNIALLGSLLERGIEGHRFDFYSGFRRAGRRRVLRARGHRATGSHHRHPLHPR